MDIELYGNLKKEWLGQYLDLRNGIPSHDTCGRVFRWLKPDAFEACFLGWVQAISALTGGQVIAIEGKALFMI